jgi:AcrR family transcriptional regulator
MATPSDGPSQLPQSPSSNASFSLTILISVGDAGAVAPTPVVTRRAQRRLDTIEEILAVALEVMTEAGVGGLSLGEVARRMRIRPPSLYQYFESKHAIYDALFAAGWREASAAVPAADAIMVAADPCATLIDGTGNFVRWAIEHPVLAQLMFWRPVPAFVPSAESYAASTAVYARFEEALRALVKRGALHRDATAARGVAAYTAIVSGVVSQHLANEPDRSFIDAHDPELIELLTGMYLDRFAPRRRQR